MIARILYKDWLLLWPMVLLVTAIQIGLQWVVFSAGLFGDSSVALELLRPLTLAWFLGMAALSVAVVHQDPIPGVDQDWLIRPVRRADVAAAKIIFILLTVCVPLFVLDLAHAKAMGFDFLPAVPVMAAKELYLLAFLLIPVMALAAITQNAPELAVLGAALIVVYALGTGLAAGVLGENRCPTCGTGFVWLEHIAQHIAVFGGACALLVMQYRRRLTTLSRWLALCAAALLVFVQIPWNLAFALQARGTPSAAALAVRLELGAAEAPPPPLTAAGGPGARQAAQALMHGDVDRAMDLVRRRAARGQDAVIDVPIRVSGVDERSLLLVDRMDLTVVRADGRMVFSGPNPDQSTMALAAGSAPLVHQSVRLPALQLAVGQESPVSLRVEYSLTLMRLVAEYPLPAMNGRLRTPELGLCATRLDAESVTLRCKQIGRAPFCYSATLVGAGGEQNPAVLNCVPDYRPYGTTFSTLSFLGLDLPVHDRFGLSHYPVDAPKAADAHLELRVYEVTDHLRRELSVTNPS